MEKRVWRYFPFGAFPQKEIWLNKMSSEGWNLKESGVFNYLFSNEDSQQFQYRLGKVPDGEPVIRKAFFDSIQEQKISMVEEEGLNGWTVFRKNVRVQPALLYAENDAECVKEGIERSLFLQLVMFGILLLRTLFLTYQLFVGQKTGLLLACLSLNLVLLFAFLNVLTGIRNLSKLFEPF